MYGAPRSGSMPVLLHVALARFNDNLDLLAMPRCAVVDGASLLMLSLAAVRAPPSAVDDRSDGITHHDAEAASEVDVDCAAHGQAPHGILRRNLFTDRHHIAFDDRPVAIISPIVHQT